MNAITARIRRIFARENTTTSDRFPYDRMDIWPVGDDFAHADAILKSDRRLQVGMWIPEAVESVR